VSPKFMPDAPPGPDAVPGQATQSSPADSESTNAAEDHEEAPAHGR
jgi:hypothetical protein